MSSTTDEKIDQPEKDGGGGEAAHGVGNPANGNLDSDNSIANDIENVDDKDVQDIRSTQQGMADYYEGLNRTISSSISRSLTGQDPNMNVMDRLEKLSREMSKLTANQMETFQMDSRDFDLNNILQYIVNFNDEHNASKPNLEVVFKNLTVIGKNASASVLLDVSDLFFKPITYVVDKIRRNKSGREKTFDFSKLAKKRKVIKDVSGYCAPGTMTLVLGRPGAGCSTLLKTLAGETKTYIRNEGTLQFSGIDSKEMFKYFKNILMYNPELDVHFPYLTVGETLSFAIACKTPSIRVDNKTRDEYIDNIKNLFEILFGLKHVEKTIVGNDFVRGVSGGERKRVSIAEAMVSEGTVCCFDNATRGLDASTALEFSQALRTFTNVKKTTSVVTIYQASESIYQLFDNVTVLYTGRQIYFGPIHEAVDYFINLGFVKEDRQTSCEFLTFITDPTARVVRKGAENVPYTVDEFEQCWMNSNEYKNLQMLIDSKLQESSTKDTFTELQDSRELLKQRWTSKHSVYSLNYISQLKLCCKRRLQTIKNNKAYTIIFVSASVMQSLIIGSLAYNTPFTTMGIFSRSGIIFFACLYFSIMTLAETPTLFEDRPILNKQYAYTMYHPSAEMISKQLINFPVRLFAIILFTIIMYFLSNMKREAGPFFQFLLMTNLVVQSVSSLFSLFSSFMPNLSAAMGFCGIAMLGMSIYSSYMIQWNQMYWWFKWFAYTNPILYAFESMITMQFRNLRMPCSERDLIPIGPFYENINTTINQICGFVGAAESKVLYHGANDINGDIYMKLAYSYTFDHCWRNFGFMFIFIAGYIAINAVIVEIYNPIPSTADKLLFIKNAKVSDAIISHFQQIAPADDDEHHFTLAELPHPTPRFHISDLPHSHFKHLRRKVTKHLQSEQEKEKDASTSDDSEEIKATESADSSFEKLGSDDIFCWKNVDYTVPYDNTEKNY